MPIFEVPIIVSVKLAGYLADKASSILNSSYLFTFIISMLSVTSFVPLQTDMLQVTIKFDYS
jgi:hypothetical protein